MQETQVQCLGREDPLEKEMATHCSSLAWKIPQTEEPGGLQSMGSQRVRHDCVTKTHTHRLPRWFCELRIHLQCRRCRRRGLIPGSGRSPRGGHCNPLQYSCLEKPMQPMAGYSPQGCQESGVTEYTQSLPKLIEVEITFFHNIYWYKHVIIYSCFTRHIQETLLKVL